MPEIAIAICSTGLVRIEHEIALVQMRYPLARKCRVLAVVNNHGVSVARNMAVKKALMDDTEILVFWDDDIIPRSNTAIRRMVEVMTQNPEVDVLGGVYPVRSDTPEPIVVKAPGEGVWWGWQDGGVHEVYMTGTGFTAIRLARLADLPAEQGDEWGNDLIVYFAEEAREGGISDDFYFAALCARGGLRWFVDGSTVCDQIDRVTGDLFSVEKSLVSIA